MLLICNNFYYISHEKHFFGGKFFEKYFSSNMLASFTEVACQRTDTFGFIRVQTIEIHIKSINLFMTEAVII